MKVAITNPFVWPHVRRGSERLLNDLACHLHSRGHEVTVLAMAPQDGRETREGVDYRLLRQRLALPLRQFNSLHDFAWRLQPLLRDCGADVVFCLNYFDAYAAVAAREQHGLRYKVAFLSVGIPTRAYFRRVPLDAWFMRKVLAQADRCLVLSRFARDSLRADFGVDAQVLPPPVFTRPFSAEPPRRGAAPLLLYVGDVEEARKGARVLCEAFVLLQARMPGLRLRFTGRAGPARQQELLAVPGMAPLRDRVEFAGVGDVGALPAHFAEASVTVLPAVWEAFGLVLVESLAAGTPVVGAAHGGIPDIVDRPLVGALFEPGPFTVESRAAQALADALLAVLARGKTPEVRAACQARAEDFSWERLGPAYEAVIESLRPEHDWEPAHG